VTRHAAVVVAAVLALMVLTPGSAEAVRSSAVEVRDLTVDVDRDLASQFGGRVDVTVRFRVVNTGERSVRPTARIKLESQIGGGTTSAPIKLATLGPGEHVDVTRTAGSLLPFGSAHVVVTVTADGQVSTASASQAVVPWLLLVTIAIVLVLAIGLRTARRRAHRRNLPLQNSPASTDE
jgi:hypothetical protein